MLTPEVRAAKITVTEGEVIYGYVVKRRITDPEDGEGFVLFVTDFRQLPERLQEAFRVNPTTRSFASGLILMYGPGDEVEALSDWGPPPHHGVYAALLSE